MDNSPSSIIEAQSTAGSNGPAQKPKDAATLIITRQDQGELKVLMGQRHANHSFMPNKYVFPGGRVSTADTQIVPHSELRDHVSRQLRFKSRRKNVSALALAAIRETFEETGLLVGHRGKPHPGATTVSTSREWCDILQAGVWPALDKLEFIARAITPPYRPKRFDARFFVASSDLIQSDFDDTTKASGELINLEWVTLERALSLELPNITHAVLGLIRERYEQQTVRPPLFFRTLNGKSISETIDID